MNGRIISLLPISLVILSVVCGSIITGEDEKNIKITSMNIDVEINSGYAVTELNASIYNPYDENLDGAFNLMLPETAFVSNFSLTLDNVTHYAQVLEKEEAKEKYSEAKSQGKTAGIVEARDMKQFSYTVNLKAYQEVVVTLRYEEFLEKRLEERQYKFALLSIYDEPISQFLLVVELNSDREITDLENIVYSDQTTVEWIDISHAKLSIKENDFLPDDDFSFKYKEEVLPVNGTLVSCYDEVNEQHYFFHIFSPQKRKLGGSMPKDIVFVLDKSGSMSGEKINQLKDAFSEIINQLPSEDRFTIIMFDKVLNTYNVELLTAAQDNINNAVSYINSFNAGGSTNIYDGLELSLEILESSEGRTSIILLLTDGLPNSGTYSTTYAIRNNIKERNLIQSPIFTLGFGSDVDFNFLTALSLENYATSKKIYTVSDASEQIQNFYDTISTTLLRDINIEYDPACEFVYPTTIPSLFEGSETVIAGICPDAEELSSQITARSKIGTKYFNSTNELNETQTENIFIYRYWAYSRINYLLDQITILGEQSSIIQEIVNLSIQGNFVTPYTALYLEVEGYQPGDGAIEEQGNEWDTSYPPGSGGGGGVPGFESLIFIFAIILAFFLRRRK
jgi:uncharacterized protein YegL